MCRADFKRDGRTGLPEFLLHASDAVGDVRFHAGFCYRSGYRVTQPRVLGTRDGAQNRDRRARLQPAADLPGGENRRFLWIVDEVITGRTHRPGADQARVEELALIGGVEEGCTLGEKRAFFRKSRRKCREVHLRRISFDLPEVGVERRVEGQIGSETHPEIGADPGSEIPPVIERIRVIPSGIHRRRSDHHREQFQPPAAADAVNTAEIAEPRGPRFFRSRNRHPIDSFIQRRNEAPDVEPPDVHRLIAEAELREWNPHFGRPPLGVDRRPGFPHRLVGVVEDLFLVAWVMAVVANARSAHAKRVRSSTIAIGVQ